LRSQADLYKLNVYSAPNGKFKPHVDTPRSKDQIGSLVVSLPSAHQGGQLTVRNAGTASQNVVFDWSTTDDSAPGEIKWAAFCSDCEHEVHEVTSGHRVTLTYNLFLTRGVGHRAGASPALDATQLPLYQRLQDALDNPGFLRRDLYLMSILQTIDCANQR
jgi:Rps23 Pro-64 3,4-dihydroxylase Tpa1-like proline 4-hydroxylase